MYHAAALPLLLLLAALFVVFVILVELHVLAYAYQKIGVKPRYVLSLMLLTLLGSHVNIPLYSLPVERIIPPHTVWFFGLPYEVPEVVQEGATLVAVNVGGALIPTLLSVYLLVRTRMWGRMLVGVITVSLVVHGLATIVPGVGIVVPIFVPPLVAAAFFLWLGARKTAGIRLVVMDMWKAFRTSTTHLHCWCTCSL